VAKEQHSMWKLRTAQHVEAHDASQHEFDGAATAAGADATSMIQAAGAAQQVEAHDVSQHTGVTRAAGADAIRFWAAWFKLHVAAHGTSQHKEQQLVQPCFA
jgi:hypothetical protein